MEKYERLFLRSREDPNSLVVEFLLAERRAERAEKNCAKSTQASAELEKILKGLLESGASLYRPEAIRRGAEGLRVICRAGSQLRELPVHPEVDGDCLEGLDSWEYVRVRENVVVGTWADDLLLFAAAQGEVVAFKDYHDRELGLVQVSEPGRGERVVRLAPHLRDEEIAPGSKLVLQRDDPGRAIAVVPGQRAHSKFEVPIEQIDTRLEDLAGIESIAR